ncbi:alginate O-acetyltransferase AlgX-related protein [Rheinheimera maricola]|uniref:AlgX/AlgJ SGNH hydrolase-like domain-containing protein n=1 Tax=Rheinheimera maricola TaxID=2793282 RepID=A0ABS7X6E3_9GAMM|nr:hypothetical protein [Rheinheimera maricola]MBZ9610362.1 hypothetical protein [Rheinheimera maricola]
MTSYVIKSRHLRASAPGVIRWCLDFPQPDAKVSLEQLQQGLRFQGWLLQQPLLSAQMYVRQGDSLHYCDLNVKRADVVEKVLRQNPVAHNQLQCGFSCKLPAQTSELIVGFMLGSTAYDFVELRIESSMKVLHGTAPWLFLDNDTNQSVAQFTGELSLDKPTLQSWHDYVSALSSLSGCDNVVLLLAPTKEMVYPEYYPHRRAGKPPVQQLLEFLPAQAPVLYPAAELAQAEQRSFRYTDTHWTHHAAMTVTVLLAQRLGLAVSEVEAQFAADEYVERSVCGDLGNKLFPPQAASEMLLSNVNYKQYLRYDNGLPNFGRVMLFENSKALTAQHCLIFGASSAYSMLNYLVRLYGKVSIVHSAGNVDPEVVSALSPDCIICQTNERFIVRAPVADYSLAEVMQGKLSDMALAERSTLLQRSADCNAGHFQAYFHLLLSRATF